MDTTKENPSLVEIPHPELPWVSDPVALVFLWAGRALHAQRRFLMQPQELWLEGSQGSHEAQLLHSSCSTFENKQKEEKTSAIAHCRGSWAVLLWECWLTRPQGVQQEHPHRHKVTPAGRGCCVTCHPQPLSCGCPDHLHHWQAP